MGGGRGGGGQKGGGIPKTSEEDDILFFFLRFYLFIFRERGRERERNINVWLSLARPLLGTWPTTQAHALTGNQTSDSLVCRPMLNALGYTSKSYFQNSYKCNLVCVHLSVFL